MSPDSKTKIKEFNDLLAWKEAHTLAVQIYSFTKLFPKEELFGLTNQMRRAAVSVSSNIAEGFGRRGYKERIQFYYLAHGSLIELKSQLLIARDVGYLSSDDYFRLEPQLISAHRLLQGLITKSKSLSALSS
jgi:four helix bundle protein